MIERHGETIEAEILRHEALEGLIPGTPVRVGFRQFRTFLEHAPAKQATRAHRLEVV